MCKGLLNEIALFLLSWEWSKIIQSVASVLMVWIAYKALTTWKQKSTADNKIRFIDELSDEVHNFIILISPAISVYSCIKIGIESYSSHDLDKKPTIASYVKNRGKKDASFLSDNLNSCISSVSKIKSLVTKGQIYNFIKYEDCHDACKLLTRQYDILRTVECAISQNWYWENTEIVETMNQALLAEVGDIQQNISQQNIKFIEFAKDNFCSLLENT